MLKKAVKELFGDKRIFFISEKKGVKEIVGEDFIELSKEEQKLLDAKVKELEKELKIKAQQKSFSNAIQAHLDKTAQNFRYDNMMSARSYAGYQNPFQEEAQKLAVWAANCWIKAGQIEAEVKQGKRNMPETVDEAIEELPVYLKNGD